MITDEEIMCALIDQVAIATHAAQMSQPSANETNVKTFITRPMWEAFSRACKTPGKSNPTPWKGLGTIRVYGSETHIIESPEIWAVSFVKP